MALHHATFLFSHDVFPQLAYPDISRPGYLGPMLYSVGNGLLLSYHIRAGQQLPVQLVHGLPHPYMHDNWLCPSVSILDGRVGVQIQLGPACSSVPAVPMTSDVVSTSVYKYLPLSLLVPSTSTL